ncbi:ABC transporter permease [Phytoactinopolyspora limicola]|uniref:ABC transporter permease n=1 Tax=Phytoactinopolyspora limicola TaxID=2715536 RepID=UPI001407597C|nr:ABC transporter permease [Phytoactinopolyspora limicola]
MTTTTPTLGPAPAPAAARPVRRRRSSALLTYGASLLAGAAIWELAGHLIDPVFLVPFTDTVRRLGELVASGELPTALLASAQVFGAGLIIAVLVGLPAGLLLARVRFLRVGLEDWITGLYAMPMVALIPFILAIFGFGFTPKVIVVFLFAVFPVIITVYEGASSIPARHIEVARSFRARERHLWRDVVIPYTIPFAMTGIRLAIARALVGMIAAEFFLAVSGLGELILITSRRFDTAAVFATILVVCILGVLLLALGHALERRFAAWRGPS